MSLLRLQQPRAPGARGRDPLSAGFPHRAGASRPHRAASHRVLGVLRRRHALADAATHGRCDPQRDRGPLAAQPRRRGDARSEPHLGRGRALPRLPRRWRQPRVARRAGHERHRPEGARAPAHGRRGDGRRRHRSVDLRALFLRPHLRPAVPIGGCLEGRAHRGHRSCRRAPVALPTHHRARHDVRKAAPRGQAHRAGCRPCPRALGRDPGGHDGARPAGL